MSDKVNLDISTHSRPLPRPFGLPIYVAVSQLAPSSGSIPAVYDRYLGPMLFHPYVSQEILGHIETPVVSLTEQHEIVRRVESLFAMADQN